MSRLELPLRLRLAPWLLSRGHVLELPSRLVEVELAGERRRVEARTLAAGQAVLLLTVAGAGHKALCPLPLLAALARVSSKECLHLQSGALYRYVQVDPGFAVAAADVALAVLPRAAAEKEPAPQTA